MMVRSELNGPVQSCAEEFRRIAGLLRDDDGDVPLADLHGPWEHYYFGEFGRFDALLRQSLAAGDPASRALLPLSISHHNLHRLFEVLHAEIGDQPLGTTRIPERITDLHEVFRRLGELLDQLGAAAVAAPPRHNHQHPD